MNHMFSPLLPRDPLQGPVLALAAHPDDEVIGCGGMLAWHRKAGHAVTVVHMSDGAQGDPGGRTDDIKAVRRREGEEALARLDIRDLRHWDLPDGQLPEHLPQIVDRLRPLIAEVKPRTLYSFFFNEAHRDHRAVGRAVVEVAGDLLPDCRCLLFGVNQVPPAGVLFDTTDTYPDKRRALEAYASQLAYIDFAEMSMYRDRAATVNIDIDGVQYAELFADLRPDQLRAAYDLCDPLCRLLLKDPG